METPTTRPRSSAETASFERTLADGRVLLRWRDELVVAAVAAALPLDDLAPGDLVRWDHGQGMARRRCTACMRSKTVPYGRPGLAAAS